MAAREIGHPVRNGLSVRGADGLDDRCIPLDCAWRGTALRSGPHFSGNPALLRPVQGHICLQWGYLRFRVVS